jgi:PPOX class probable F420-dependent enzyme
MSADLGAGLTNESYLSLATFRRDGRAVETPVWFAPAGAHYYVFSESRAGKMKRLRNDAHVRVAACDVRGKVHGEWLEGSARCVDDDESIDIAYDALLAKYGWMMRITDFFSKLTGRFDARAIIQITLEPADRESP